MLNVLQPYAIYIFYKATGVVALTSLVVPIKQLTSEFWDDVVRRYDPRHMADYASEEMTHLTEIVQVTSRKNGWKLSNWHIAHLNPTEHTEGNYESCFLIEVRNELGPKISINTENSGSRTASQCGQDGNSTRTGVACMCTEG